MRGTKMLYPDRQEYSSPGRSNNFNRRSTYSMDETTLNDDDPVDNLEMDGETEGFDASTNKYDEKYMNERSAINDAQSVRYTAYSFTMKQDSGFSIVGELRNVGVTVLSLESLSTEAMIHYMDAVTSMRLGDSNDEKCMLYIDRMDRVFNVVVSGGAEGLAKKWSAVQAAYSGWMAIISIPFLTRVISSYPIDDDEEIFMTVDPLMLLLVFALILNNEISQSWLAMSIFVRGTNSVGSHVWRGSGLTDYPRILLLLILILASFAPPSSPVREILTISGSAFGCLLLLCNLGSRAWKKTDLGFIDSSNIFTPLLVVLSSIFAGLTFPYMGLKSVAAGTDENYGKDDVEKAIFHPNGKRARQNITIATTATAISYLALEVPQVQESLGFGFSNHHGYLSVAVGGWIFLSSLISMSLCHRLDSSGSKKIEPFLRRDESSPVGWIVPSIPNIVIDHNLSRGFSRRGGISLLSDIICSLVVVGLAFLIAWTGVREMQGYTSTVFW